MEKATRYDPHPMQRIVTDKNGVVRFRCNEIVRWLCDNGHIDLNTIAILPFDGEDREQFAQLLGYSVSGYGGLDYVSQESMDAADRMAADPLLSEADSRLNTLRDTLTETRSAVKSAAVALFQIHPDDLTQ